MKPLLRAFAMLCPGAWPALACAQPTIAGEPIHVVIGDHMTISAGGLTGRPRSSGLAVVYDSTRILDGNTGVPANWFFVGGGTANSGDALTLELPRSGHGLRPGSSFLLDELTFSVFAEPDEYPLVDVYHLFYDDAAVWAAPGAELMRRPLAGMVVRVAPCDSDHCDWTWDFTVTNISSEVSIPFTDNFVGYQMVITDLSGNIAAGAVATFNGDHTPSGLDGKFVAGRSEDLFYVDFNGNSFFDGEEGLYSFGGSPFTANLYLRLSVLACDADLDGSGFVDTDDFDAFILAFESGC